MAKSTFDPSPWGLAGSTEHSHQRAIFAWANCATVFGFAIANSTEGYTKNTRELLMSEGPDIIPVPELRWLHAIHNQGHGDKIRGAMAKAEGVKSGVSDMFLPVTRNLPYRTYAGLYVELKRPELQPARGGNGGVSDEQREFMEYAREQGYHATVAYGWEDAVSIIQRYIQSW